MKPEILRLLALYVYSQNSASTRKYLVLQLPPPKEVASTPCRETMCEMLCFLQINGDVLIKTVHRWSKYTHIEGVLVLGGTRSTTSTNGRNTASTFTTRCRELKYLKYKERPQYRTPNYCELGTALSTEPQNTAQQCPTWIRPNCGEYTKFLKPLGKNIYFAPRYWEHLCRLARVAHTAAGFSLGSCCSPSTYGHVTRVLCRRTRIPIHPRPMACARTTVFFVLASFSR